MLYFGRRQKHTSVIGAEFLGLKQNNIGVKLSKVSTCAGDVELRLIFTRLLTGRLVVNAATSVMTLMAPIFTGNVIKMVVFGVVTLIHIIWILEAVGAKFGAISHFG